MQINVTPSDIANGVGGSALLCPVAHAVNRAIRPSRVRQLLNRLLRRDTQYPYVCVGSNLVDIWSGDGELSQMVGLPHDVTQRINTFDDWAVMEPFSFELPVELPL